MSSVDVIVPCYKYGDLLAGCVDSILSQEGVDVRVLIVDDASPDNTAEVGSRLASTDSRVEFWRHARNFGHIATYNEALDWVRADYCVILSADDLLSPFSLLRAARVMDAHPEVTFTWGRDVTFRYAPPVETTPVPPHARHTISSYPEFLERSCRLGQTGIQSPTVVVRSSVHRAVGGYLPELPHSGDTEIWLRLAARGAVAEIDANQAFRRLHAHNMSLGYSPLSRLAEQVKAFDTHFATCFDARPYAGTLVPIVKRTIGEAAFWSAAHAFDAGDDDACGQFLDFALSLSPDLETTSAWKRLRWKRRIGRIGWHYLQPLAALLRPAASPTSDGR